MCDSKCCAGNSYHGYWLTQCVQLYIYYAQLVVNHFQAPVTKSVFSGNEVPIYETVCISSPLIDQELVGVEVAQVPPDQPDFNFGSTVLGKLDCMDVAVHVFVNSCLAWSQSV